MSHVLWTPGMSLEDVERQVIEAALRHYPSKAATAAALGIAVRSIDYKQEKWRLDDAAARDALERREAAQREFLARARGELKTPEQKAADKVAAAGELRQAQPEQLAPQFPPAQESVPEVFERIFAESTPEQHPKAPEPKRPAMPPKRELPDLRPTRR